MDGKDEIEKQFINPDMLRQFIEQLQKDFYFSDPIQALDINTLHADEVYPLVYGEVKRLMNKDYGGLQNTLYKIDISEQQLKKEFAESAIRDEVEILTYLIMKRELQKIVYRNYFKNTKHEN